ncbi:PREDICTED: uncharacterized protein LOC106125873 isoform X2 [Papilio xuthus]|uniref:Uncharacterized protein LOC106125873 isoform X2 n=1 Tax=Papilio xuthus TaxID=66420 RepID=A0AAJ7EIK8_PAPXU|nr:PREDICTED: uncharacterized protein LOC106125873 isoform X2 [Papilio xuthus]
MYQDESNTLTYTVQGEGSPGPRPSKKGSGCPLNPQPTLPEDDQEWFKEQYERKIGTPASCTTPDINVILKNLILKNKSPKESAAYDEPVNPKTEAKLLKWPDMPNIKKCLCKDFGCICRGCKLSEAVSIPYVCLKCPEFCASRCISFKFETPEQIPSRTEHLEEKLRLDEYSFTLKKRRMRRMMKYQQEHAREIEEGDYEVKDECANVNESRSNLSRWKFGSKIFKKKG